MRALLGVPAVALLLACPVAGQVTGEVPPSPRPAADPLSGIPAQDEPHRPDDDLPLLTLEEVTEMVLRQNPTLAIARLEREIAEAEAAPGAVGLYPTMNVGLAQRRAPTPIGREGLANETLDLTAGARFTVFDGFARSARLRRLRTLTEVRDLDAQALTQDLVAEAHVVYFDVARVQQRLVVLHEAVELSEERLRIATARRDVGAAADLEVNRALVDLNADRAVLLRQEAALAQAKAHLNRLLNRPDGAPFRAEDEIEISRDLEHTALQDATLSQSPDLLADIAAERAAELQQTALRRDFWPRLDLNLGYAFSELTDPLLPPGQTGGFSYGLTATFDLFDGFERRRRNEVASIRREQAALTSERTRTSLLTGLESTYALYERSLQLVELEEANVAAARQNAVVALERFRLGVSTSIELREVQRALVDAESRLVAARFEAKAAEVELRALAGGLVE